MIYSRTGKYIIDQVNRNNLRTLIQWVPSNDDIFYHQRYEYLNDGITIEDSIDPNHWMHISENPLCKFVHENCIETFDETIADEIKTIVEKYKINPNQFYFLLADENHCSFLKKELENRNIEGCNFDFYNALLHRVHGPSENVGYKFSILSRNYNRWRLNLYLELQRRSILDSCVYSFHNIKPYNDTDNIIDKEEIRKDVIGELTKSVNKWIKHLPYNLSSSDDVRNKYSDYSYNAISNSSINILIETHFQPVTDKNYCAHITEKTYKNIISKKPFLVFATPGWLTDFQKLGYKTFSPYINENYDTITDNYSRLLALCDEIQRLNNLTKEEFSRTVAGCQRIVDYNYQLFLERKNREMSDNFKFLK